MNAQGARYSHRYLRSVLSRRPPVRATSAITALSTAFFVLAASVGLSNPGLQYDELLFVNAALGNTHPYHGFIYRESFGIPTLLLPYIGALKAWLYSPIFAVFGVSVDSIRVPIVLAAVVALVLAVLLVRRLLGPWPAALLAVLLATDPVYAAVARADWGPIVLSALLRTAALLCYFAFIRRHAARYLWLLVAVLSLGLYNKLDFVWFIAGLGVAALVVHHGELLDHVRRRRIDLVLPIAAFGVVLVVALVTLILPATRLPVAASHASLGGRVSEVAHLFRVTVDGSGVYQYMTGVPLDHVTLMGSLFPWILIGCVAVAAWSLTRGRRMAPGDPLRGAVSATTFFLVLFVVLAVGLVLTRQATGPQHIMLLWPLPDVLAVCLLTVAVRAPMRAASRVAVAVLGVGLAALLVTQLRTTSAYVHAYRSSRQWSPIWSAEIYAAARAVRRSAPQADSIISADWGLGTQVFALGNDGVRGRFSDPWGSFTDPAATVATLQQQWFSGRRVIVLYHAQTAQIMPLTTQRVEAILRGFGPRVHAIYVGRQIEADLVDAR